MNRAPGSISHSENTPEDLNSGEFERALQSVLRSELPTGAPRAAEQSLHALQARIVGLRESQPSLFSESAVADRSDRNERPFDSRTLKSSYARYLWTALAACLGLGFGVSAWNRVNQTEQSSLAATHSALLREFATKNGQRARFTLPDGTLVELNVSSRLRIPDNFGKGERRVFLDGEALFTVTHNAERPFLVEAGGTTIRDLATVFNVRAYPGTGTTSVAVTEGRVTVAAHAIAPRNQATVEANQVALVTTDGNTRVTLMQDPTDYMGWTQNILKFNDAPLGEVLTELSRWYGIEFRLMDTHLATNRVTMTVRGTRFSDEQIRGFAEAIDARITQNGPASFVIQRASRDVSPGHSR